MTTDDTLRLMREDLAFLKERNLPGRIAVQRGIDEIERLRTELADRDRVERPAMTPDDLIEQGGTMTSSVHIEHLHIADPLGLEAEIERLRAELALYRPTEGTAVVSGIHEDQT